MSISLLPNDLRDKERQEKEKVRQAMTGKSFKMHVPGDQEMSSDDSPIVTKDKGEDVQIGLSQDKPQEKRGIFRVVKQEKKVIPPPVPPKPRPVSRPVPPKPEVVPMQVSKKEPSTFLMRIPKWIEKKKAKNGKKIFQETADQLDDVISPPPISEYFHRDLKKVAEGREEAEINLMENDYEFIVQKKFWNRMRGLIIVALFFLILFSGVFVYLKMQKTILVTEYNQVNQLIAQTDAEINTYGFEKMQAIALKDRAMVLRLLLDQHIYWTTFLSLLEQNTIKDVYYTNFVANSAGDISLSAKAKNYNNVAEQLLLFQEADFIEQVDISSASKEKEEEEFTEEGVLIDVADEEVVNEYPVDFSVTIKLKNEALAKN